MRREKLYINGYLNRVRSSRRLEREAHRNIEVIWLLRSLRPDFKTIADFRRDNRPAFRAVFRQFVLLCRISMAANCSPSTEPASRQSTTRIGTLPANALAGERGCGQKETDRSRKKVASAASPHAKRGEIGGTENARNCQSRTIESLPEIGEPKGTPRLWPVQGKLRDRR
jgi:hypothetical protein